MAAPFASLAHSSRMSRPESLGRFRSRLSQTGAKSTQTFHPAHAPFPLPHPYPSRHVLHAHGRQRHRCDGGSATTAAVLLSRPPATPRAARTRSGSSRHSDSTRKCVLMWSQAALRRAPNSSVVSSQARAGVVAVSRPSNQATAVPWSINSFISPGRREASAPMKAFSP